MATITLRLDDWTREEIERLAQARGTTISDLLRSTIDELLGKDVETVRAETPRSLDMVARRTLALQHEILARLAVDEGEAEHHRRRIQVLEDGFTAEYGGEFIAMGPELTVSECSVVWDILDMFSVLEASVERLSPDDLAGLDAGHRLSFIGFDGNHSRESRMLAYTRYLIATGRWTNLANRVTAHDDGNSHIPMLADYQRMLRAFQPIWKSKALRGGGPDAAIFNATELSQILAV